MAAFNRQVIYWPSDDATNFIELCGVAMEEGADIVISAGTVVRLDSNSTVKVSKKHTRLSIRGEGSEGAVIIGESHSVFVVEGKQTQLHLGNVTVRHECRAIDKRDIGAVLYVRNAGSATCNGCILLSETGFALWAVQKARVSLNNCAARSVQRSGCVIFCDAQIRINHSVIYGCKLHGLCARGRASVDLKSSKVLMCGRRGIYAYHNVELGLENCRIAKIGYLPDANTIEAAAVLADGILNMNIFEQIGIKRVGSFTAEEAAEGEADKSVGSAISIATDNLLARTAALEVAGRDDSCVDSADNSDPKSKENFTSPRPLTLTIVRSEIRENAILDISFKGHMRGRLEGLIIEIVSSLNPNCSDWWHRESDNNFSIDSGSRSDLELLCVHYNEPSSSTSVDVCVPDRSTLSLFIWEFQCDDPSGYSIKMNESNWVEFDTDSSALLEERYQLMLQSEKVENRSNDPEPKLDEVGEIDLPTSQESIVVLPGSSGAEYIIDLVNMIQTNSRTLYERAVRRRRERTIT